MNKILAILLVAAVSCFALAPTNSATNGNYSWDVDYTISSAAGFDTVGGAADSSTLISLRPLQTGYEYILVRDAITGDGSDSIKISLSARMYDINKNLMYTVEVDSFTAAAGEAVSIPVGGTLFGSYMTLKAMTYTDNGGVVILNRMYLLKRKVLSTVKNWMGE